MVLYEFRQMVNVLCIKKKINFDFEDIPTGTVRSTLEIADQVSIEAR